MTPLTGWGRFCALVAICVTSAPGLASADIFITRSSESVIVQERKVLIAQTGVLQSLIEELEMTSTARDFLWLRAFPSEPKRSEAPDKMFQVLAANTVVQEPHNEKIRRNLFGPSVVTALSRRIIADSVRPPTIPYQPPTRRLEVDASMAFTGRVTSSTITMELLLPPDMQAWVDRQGYKIEEDVVRELARYFNRDWVILASVVSDGAPGSETRARLGPFRFNFETRTPVYPRMSRRFDRSSKSAFYLVGGEPLAPTTVRTMWNARPWEKGEIRRGEFVAQFSGPIIMDESIAYELVDKAGVLLPPDAHLVRSVYERGAEAAVDMSFAPVPDAIPIPGSGRRGSTSDILLCLLLGLTPLIYTPESWFLLWLAARAKDKVRREGQGFGTRLWSLYAVVVAIFWFATMDGAGRIAGVIPMLIGLVQLALPYTERDSAPVRVQFTTKKKA